MTTSQKPNAYINGIIPRPSYIPFPCWVQWSGRTPRAVVVSCPRPFPQSFSVLQPQPWGTLLEGVRHVNLGWALFSAGQGDRWADCTEDSILAQDAVLSKFHVFWSGLSCAILCAYLCSTPGSQCGKGMWFLPRHTLSLVSQVVSAIGAGSDLGELTEVSACFSVQLRPTATLKHLNHCWKKLN